MTLDPAEVRLAVEVADDLEDVATHGAATIARIAREAISEHGSCAIAVSGGHTPVAMFRALANEEAPWPAIDIWQVDERIAPRGHEDRNLTDLQASLPEPALGRLHPMPVDDLDPDDDAACDAAAADYAASLPPAFDLIHLGIGDDGHTASLVSADPVLEVRDRDAASTSQYRGRRRITLTYPALDRADRVLWIVAGVEKAEMLERLVARDPSIPAARVACPAQAAIVDRAAASGLPSG